MTPEQSLELLYKATGLMQLNREDHQNIAIAVSTLREAISKKEVAPEVEIIPEKDSKNK